MNDVPNDPIARVAQRWAEHPHPKQLHADITKAAAAMVERRLKSPGEFLMYQWAEPDQRTTFVADVDRAVADRLREIAQRLDPGQPLFGGETVDLFAAEQATSRCSQILDAIDLGVPFTRDPEPGMREPAFARTPRTLENELYCNGLRRFRVEWNEHEPHSPKLMGDPERNR